MNGKGRKRSLHSLCVFMIMLTVLQLVGCGRTQKEQESTEAPVRQEMSWQGESFAELASLTDGNPIYLAEYQEGIGGLPELPEDMTSKNFEYLGIYQDKVYFFDTCSDSEWIVNEEGSYVLSISKEQYFLSVCDLETGEWECRDMSFDYRPAAGGVSGGELVFFSKDENEESVEHYYAIYMDLDGTVRTMLDIYPAIQEFGMELSPRSIIDFVDCDPRGYLYVKDDKKSRVGVIDGTGTLVSVMEPGLERAEGVGCFLKTRDGIPVFGTSGIKGTDKTTLLFWYDDEKSDMSILGESWYTGVISSTGYMDQYGDVWLSMNGSIVRWNWETGVREKVFDYSSSGISVNQSLKHFVTGEDGRIFMFDLYGDTVQLYGFSETEPDYEGALRIADIYSLQADEFLQSCAAGFSRKNPLWHVGYELADHDRIINEIVAGAGPDMLIVDRDDMETLYEKGVLADLTDVLPEETQEQIFTCVLEAGRIDGRLIGLADYASGWTLYVSGNDWNKHTWSVEEFVDLAESKEGELEALIVAQSPYSQTASGTFNSIALMDMENSPFIDWEKGKCFFGDPLFRRVLALCMRYGKPIDSNYNYMTDQTAYEAAAVQGLKEGHVLAYFGNGIGNVHTFSHEMAMLGDGFYSVGFPTGEKSGAFCATNSFLVVNAKTENPDAVYDFLRHCFSYDTQRSDYANVRKDVTRAFVVQDYDDQWSYSLGGGVSILLESKPNGDSWLEEYLDCMDECVPRPDKSWDVIRMIQEETDYYFNGERDMDQTIDVLQRRVQLYLDEHKQ